MNNPTIAETVPFLYTKDVSNNFPANIPPFATKKEHGFIHTLFLFI